MDSEFWAAVAGAIVGALAGGGMTWLLQRFQSKEDRREREKALARSLIFKLMRIHTDLDALSKHVARCEAKAGEDDLPVGWQSLQPMASLPGEVVFSSDEMSYLLSLGDFDLFNDVLSLDVIRAAGIEMFRLYTARRLELTSMLPAQMDGLIGRVELTGEQMALVAPRAAELNDLVRQIRERVVNDAEDARQALARTANATAGTLGGRMMLEFANAPEGGAGEPDRAPH